MNVECVKVLVKSPVFQNFLRQKESFDVVLVQLMVGDALLSLGHYFNAPVIGISPSALNKWTRNAVGAPNLASFVPNMLTGYSDRMGFWQRAYNSLCYLYDDVTYSQYYARDQQEILQKMYPNDEKMPSFDALLRNISVVLYNSHPVFHSPSPAQPNLIPVGGLFIDRNNPTPLPSDIETFLNDSIAAIYVAFGTNTELSSFGTRQRNAIINGFSEYPNMRLILQSKKSITIPSHKPSDVMVRPYFPQQAILAHPKIKLFITHGGTFFASKSFEKLWIFDVSFSLKGMLSTTEAVHFAKPIIGIPIFYDQHMNMEIAEQRGFGISLPYEKLYTYKLRDAVRKIFTDPRFEIPKGIQSKSFFTWINLTKVCFLIHSYIQQTKLASFSYWYQIKTPLETAIYWVKHVARHKGAPHLRSIAIDMPFYVYYNLDCYAVIVAFCALMIFINIKLCKLLFARYFKKSSANKLKKS